jgi:two-component system OmpR family response regulator
MMRGQVTACRKRSNVVSSNASVLIVEDNAIIGNVMAQCLETSQFAVAVVNNGVAMDSLLAARVYNLVVLGLNLPGENGLSICRRLRNCDKGRLSIVMVAAQSDVIDKIVGLEMGADDYITIPFNPGEFLARIRSVLRRKFWLGGLKIADGQRRCHFADWHLNVFTGEVLGPDNAKVVLTEAEKNLLQIFCENPNCVLTRSQLIDMMQGPTAGPFERSIDILVSRLRKRLETIPKLPQLIQTVRSAGYMFSLPVTSV